MHRRGRQAAQRRERLAKHRIHALLDRLLEPGEQTTVAVHRDRDRAVLKIVLKVKDGAGGSYHWVECGSCECAWQVPYYAASVG